MTTLAPPAATILPTPAVDERAHSLWPTRLALLLLAPALFLACLHLYTRENTFPFSYHPDEATKAYQIMFRNRNYLHPQLLLEATQHLVSYLKTPLREQPVVQVGRFVSATFAALAVTALALAAARSFGLAGFLVAGAAVALCPPLFAYAHYMKEDAALVFGLAVTALAAKLLWHARSLATEIPSLLFLGLGCALATSGKYVGLISLLIALPVLCLKPHRTWPRLLLRPLLFTAATLAALALVNHQVLEHREAFLRGFGAEEAHYRTSHHGLTMHRPNAFFLGAYVHDAQPHIQLLSLLAVVLLPITWRRRSWWDVAIVLFPIVFLLSLGWCILPFHRYLLPVHVFAHFLAALAILWTYQAIATHHPRPAAAVLAASLALLLWLQVPLMRNYLHQFADDGRDRLRQYIYDHVPPGSIIAADQFTGLLGPSNTSHNRPPVNLLDKRIMIQGHMMFAPDLGPLDSLRRSCSYAAVCDTTYARFFSPHVIAAEGEQDQRTRRRDWYAKLFSDYELIWSNDPQPPTHSYTNPPLRLYRLK